MERSNKQRNNNKKEEEKMFENELTYYCSDGIIKGTKQNKTSAVPRPPSRRSIAGRV
jgi:hypothetical protein